MGRRFGQHFLARRSILDRIATACGPAAKIIEIGPGKGALTESLLAARPATVIAVEVDPVLVHYLQQKFRDPIEAGRLKLIHGDVLKTDLAALASPDGAVIAGNLPYYITSPILEHVFLLGAGWKRAVFLVQAEVAARLAGEPGSRDYGYLSILAQVYSKPRILCEVPRAAFRPPPKVDSAVVVLEPRDANAEFGLADREAFLRFASDCFRHKRKTLRNNLAPRYGRERIDALPEAGLRAEQLSVADLVRLYQQLETEAIA